MGLRVTWLRTERGFVLRERERAREREREREKERERERERESSSVTSGLHREAEGPQSLPEFHHTHTHTHTLGVHFLNLDLYSLTGYNVSRVSGRNVSMFSACGSVDLNPLYLTFHVLTAVTPQTCDVL